MATSATRRNSKAKRDNSAKATVADQISQAVQSTSNLLHLMQQSSPAQVSFLSFASSLYFLWDFLIPLTLDSEFDGFDRMGLFCCCQWCFGLELRDKILWYGSKLQIFKAFKFQQTVLSFKWIWENIWFSLCSSIHWECVNYKVYWFVCRPNLRSFQRTSWPKHPQSRTQNEYAHLPGEDN